MASSSTTTSPNPDHVTAVIALGSNLGDRFYNIELALRLLEVPHQDLQEWEPNMFLTVVDTSFMYETTPMYVVDQPSFINCACLIETNIPPTSLLCLLKHIEFVVGRIPSVSNGPRAIDLDVVFYGNAVIDTRPLSEQTTLSNLRGQLVVPHPRVLEREFVLRPLNDMIPDYVHPVYQKPIYSLLENLQEEDPSMRKVVPFPRYPLVSKNPWPYPAIPVVPTTLTYWTYPIIGKRQKSVFKRKTYLMATLNVTPDSFSDGGSHNTLNTAIDYAQESVKAGASIIDIGGCSTKPNAAFVTTDEETDRVLPIIQAIRGRDSISSEADIRLREIPISVDTFRWEVARTSILAGANCINDVYAFMGWDSYPAANDEVEKRIADSMAGMKAVAREFAVPVILMHSRGDAGKNKDYSMYADDTARAVIRGVQTELGDKVKRIIKGKGGVRRWMIIVDPGIGFSKTLEGNLELLREAAHLVTDARLNSSKRNPLKGFPQLIGTSRKSFLGAILSRGERGRDTTPKDRIWATATTVTCAVQQGAMIVRVHDTREMADVIYVADELWG